jgi:hypothetical protein
MTRGRAVFLARCFSIFALAVALGACFAVLLLSWPDPRDVMQSYASSRAGCCDEVVKSSTDLDEAKVPYVIAIGITGKPARQSATSALGAGKSQ